MRLRKIPALLCGALLCFGASAAYCQSLSGSLAANQQSTSGIEDETGSSVNGSSVSADVSAGSGADFHADFSAQVKSGSGGGGARAGAGGYAVRGAVQGTRMRPSSRSLARANRRMDTTTTKATRRGAASGFRGGSKMQEMTPAERRIAMRASFAGKGMKSRGSGGSGPATYSTDFPDSTKGTALISPPDPGTASPLDWSTGLNFGFRDFTAQQFLNPTLGGQSRLELKRKAAARRSTPAADDLGSTGLSDSLDTSLEPGGLQPEILNSSGPTSILDQQ